MCIEVWHYCRPGFVWSQFSARECMFPDWIMLFPPQPIDFSTIRDGASLLVECPGMCAGRRLNHSNSPRTWNVRYIQMCGDVGNAGGIHCTCQKMWLNSQWFVLQKLSKSISSILCNRILSDLCRISIILGLFKVFAGRGLLAGNKSDDPIMHSNSYIRKSYTLVKIFQLHRKITTRTLRKQAQRPGCIQTKNSFVCWLGVQKCWSFVDLISKSQSC